MNFKVQRAPDGKQFEVIERTTLNLFGVYPTKEEAQARADFLAMDGEGK